MQRHRMIYAALSEELKNGLHALCLNTNTQAEILEAEAHTPQGSHWEWQFVRYQLIYFLTPETDGREMNDEWSFETDEIDRGDRGSS
jgi:BolA-like protein